MNRPSTYLSYVGIRVTDLDRSLKFYAELFGLKIIERGDNTRNGGGPYVLLRDKMSGQKLELNWYPEGSAYNTPYSPGDGLDHVAFRVDDVAQSVKELAKRGVEVVNIPPSIAKPNLGTPFSTNLAYVKDPDGNWIELYDHSQPIGSKISESY